MSTSEHVSARPPRGLKAPGRALFRALSGQIESDGLVFDAREATLLHHACRETDMLAAIEAELAKADGLTVRGAQGQLVSHPLLGEARRSRAQIAALLKAIGLEDPSAAAPAGRGSRTTSWQARDAANARHGAS